MDENFASFIQAQTTEWSKEAQARIAELSPARDSVAKLIASLAAQLAGAQQQLADIDSEVASLQSMIARAPALSDAISAVITSSTVTLSLPAAVSVP